MKGFFAFFNFSSLIFSFENILPLNGSNRVFRRFYGGGQKASMFHWGSRLAWSTIFSLAAFMASAQISSDSLDGRVNAINTAVPFLRISPDARSGAMGDAGVALSPDANAVFWNLSKLPFAKEDAALSLNYTPWLKELVNDVFLATVSGYKKLDEYQAIGASLRYFDIGNVQLTDYAGVSQGNFHPREFAIDGGYARKLSENWSVGLALRYIYSNLASGTSLDGSNATYRPGQSVAGDISAYYTQEVDYDNDQHGGLSAGLAITNVGTKISYTNNNDKDFIPTNMDIGAAYTHHIDDYNKITFAFDVNKLLVPTPDTTDRNGNGLPDYREKTVVQGIFQSFGDAPGGFKEELHELMYSFGLEYWYNDVFAVRAGYFNEYKSKGNRKYLTLGLGLKYNTLGFNFSYLVPSGAGIQRNPLSNTLRFSLLLDLGKQDD